MSSLVKPLALEGLEEEAGGGKREDGAEAVGSGLGLAGREGEVVELKLRKEV
jgi:hypothetical protein